MRFPVDGHEIDYEVRGEGRPVVLVHGLTVDRRILIEACEPALSATPGWKRIYLDLPGHGRSSGEPAHASADHLVYALGSFVNQVAGNGAALIGYSYGGYLALGMARDLAGLSGLFLCCPVVEPDFGKRVLPPHRVVTSDPDLVYRDDRERETFWGEAVVQSRPQLELFRRVVQPAHVEADRGFVDATRSRYAMSRLYMQAMTSFTKPVTVVCGRDDYWAGYEDPLRLVRAFTGCHFAVLPDAGHLLPLEAPARFTALLADWLGRL
jgi:pimeloyl-ACP methyl ester carboxylesterase